MHRFGNLIGEKEIRTGGSTGRSTDLALSVLAVAPPAFVLLELSTPMLLSRAPTYPEIYAAYRYRLPLLTTGTLAGVTLLWRSLRGAAPKGLAKGAAGALAGLAVLAPFVYDPSLFSARKTGVSVLRAEEAGEALPEDDTEVFGVIINGEARAYPARKAARPHFIADVLGGERIVLTYCGLTNSAIVYRPEDGRSPHFAVLSAPNNNILYWEGNTGTLVQQLLPEPAYGPVKDRLRLRPWPVAFTTWEAWHHLIPETTLGDPPYESLHDRFVTWQMRLRHERTRVEEKPFLAVAGEVDRTLHPKARVFALHEGGEARAYTRGFLEEERAFNDSAGGTPVAILYDPKSGIAAAYRGELDGRWLSFRPAVAGGFEDEETGTRWDVLGRGTTGELAGRALDPVPFSFDKIFWFAWKHYQPDTALLHLPGERGEPKTARVGPESLVGAG